MPEDSVLSVVDSGEEPLLLHGPPAELRGSLRVANRSDEKVKVRAAPMQCNGLQGAGACPVEELQLNVS